MKYQGLSHEEVKERKAAGLQNITKAKTGKSVGEIIATNIFTYFNLVFLIISILLFTADSSIRNFSFLPVVIANSLIGIIQELRAKKVLDALQVLSAPVAHVVRDGKLREVPVTDLVKDDVIFLKAGDQISADARLLGGELSVNESLLTGESDEIIKTTGSDLMSGSFVVYGEGYAELTRVGDDSYAAELTLKAKAIKSGEQSKIIAGLNKFIRIAGVTIIPLSILMVASQMLLRGLSYREATEAMVAAVIGMIPEGLFLLASATLVLSAARLAKQKVLLHDMKCIETLARVNVLCVDKTGTITSGKMHLQDTIWLKKPAETELSSMIAALSADSETMVALKNAYKKPQNPKSIAKVQGFTSRLKYSGVEFTDGEVFVIGAPELVLRANFIKFNDQISAFTAKGLRVLVFAKYSGKLTNESLTAKATPLAFLIIEDEIRASASATFQYFNDQGVEIKVISGDAPLTVSAIAARAGIKNADKYTELSERLSDEELRRAATKYTVFGRVTPADKRRLVRALQANGAAVAMTGDGVNDVLALKDADCSVAMASGSQAAADAAQMVLLNSDFSKMPDVVMEGRRVVNNLERSGSLFIVKNLVSFVAALLTLIFRIKYPMLPAQVSLISLWAIGIPSFLLAQIPNKKLIKGEFIPNILRVAIPTALTAILMLSISNYVMHLTGVNPRFYGTISTIVWASVGIGHLFLVAKPYNKYSLAISLFCLVGVLVCLFGFKNLFYIESGFGLREWLIVFVALIIAEPLILIFRKLFSKIPLYKTAKV